MTQKRLDDSNVGVALKQVGRKTVAQRVGSRQAVEPRLADVFFEQSPHAASRETPAVLVEEYRPLLQRRRGRIG